MWENIQIIFFRLFLALVFSGFIGYEREVSESHAGLKTHILVAIGATLIGLIQIEITEYVHLFALNSPLESINVTADASRLVAQVISGIGFLGAGTIIVTKSNISGLTTAASIWTVASIGVALGMGFYLIAIFGFVFVITTLFTFKRFVNISRSYTIIVKYIGGDQVLQEIKNALNELGFEYRLTAYKSDLYADHIIRENSFRIKDNNLDFQDIISRFSTTKNIISIERSNIHQ